MKKILIVCLSFVATISVLAQSSDWTTRNVRDPVQLREKLNTDGTAIDDRLTALEGSTNVNGSGVFASITAGTVTVQTNATVGGTLGVTGATTIQGATSVNSLSVTGASASVAGTLAVTGVATFTAQPVFNEAILAAPTNEAVAGLSVRINGTNYVIAVSIPND
jgi:fibronectin-binding autotransporter adhesin